MMHQRGTRHSSCVVTQKAFSGSMSRTQVLRASSTRSLMSSTNSTISRTNRPNHHQYSPTAYKWSSTVATLRPSLLIVLTWSMTLLLVSSCLGIADAGTLMGHPFSKRSFMDIQCKGVYDKSLFARLDRICEDCYNLFREPQLHTLCRKNCFTSDYFKGCLDVLLLQDEMEWIQTSIKQLHGADPGV